MFPTLNTAGQRQTPGNAGRGSRPGPAATRKFRGDGSRRRIGRDVDSPRMIRESRRGPAAETRPRGRDADMPRRRVAAPPRVEWDLIAGKFNRVPCIHVDLPWRRVAPGRRRRRGPAGGIFCGDESRRRRARDEWTTAWRCPSDSTAGRRTTDGSPRPGFTKNSLARRSTCNGRRPLDSSNFYSSERVSLREAPARPETSRVAAAPGPPSVAAPGPRSGPSDC